MRLLAIDTSSGSTIVVAADGERLAERRHDPVGKERPQHTAAGLVLAAEALAELCLDWTGLERIGVGVGPGSFTGLRAGLSAAAGLARRLGIPLVAVTGGAILRRGAEDALPASARIVTAVDGRRKELFVTREGAARPEDEHVDVIRRDGLEALGDLTGAVVVGDGAVLEREALLALGADVPEPESVLHQLQASVLARLAAEGEPRPADAVRPHYGRAADAVTTAERAAAATSPSGTGSGGR